jgi:nitrogen-specific signal transduction histidine kinase
VVAVHDVTERMRAQAALLRTEGQLRQSQKLEAIGSLAGGIAHDFNNLLSVVLSYSALMRTGLPPDDAVGVQIEQIQEAGMRAAQLTRQLLAFSRRQLLEPKVVDLGAIVGGLEKILGRLLGEGVGLSVRGAAALGKVHADPSQLEQIVMNLAVNARDAMVGGGTLTIEMANVDLDAAYAEAQPGVTPGPYVVLAVTDTGSGMDEATQARAFEPFFTTKAVGSGTGLGLSTVYGIVKQSGGHVQLQSEVGRGTRLRVYLPRTDRASERAASAHDPLAALDGSETILLVEDDEQVRAASRMILRRHGYLVLEAPNGSEALLICGRFEDRIDLLVTDVVMPFMSGAELAERLRPLRPSMRVLFVSGYTDSVVLRHGILDSEIAFLHKPITPDGLARKVREVLDGP